MVVDYSVDLNRTLPIRFDSFLVRQAIYHRCKENSGMISSSIMIALLRS